MDATQSIDNFTQQKADIPPDETKSITADKASKKKKKKKKSKAAPNTTPPIETHSLTITKNEETKPTNKKQIITAESSTNTPQVTTNDNSTNTIPLSTNESSTNTIPLDPISLLSLFDISSSNLTQIEQLEDSLRQHLKLVEAKKLQLQREEYEKLKTMQKKQEDRMLCPICMENTKNTSFNPCGHVLCGECSKQIMTIGKKKCPICRVNVKNTMELFL